MPISPARLAAAVCCSRNLTAPELSLLRLNIARIAKYAREFSLEDKRDREWGVKNGCQAQISRLPDFHALALGTIHLVSRGDVEGSIELGLIRHDHIGAVFA